MKKKWEMDTWCGKVFKDTGKPGGCENYKKRKNEEIPLVCFASDNVSDN